MRCNETAHFIAASVLSIYVARSLPIGPWIHPVYEYRQS